MYADPGAGISGKHHGLNSYMLEWKQRSKQKQYNLLWFVADECEDKSMKKEENT
jgi:hypothetical protein